MDMVMSATIDKIAKALVSAQKNMGSIVKDSKNPFFKSSYATLNAVREACIPQLNEVGISVLQPIVQKEGISYVRTLLLHDSGEYLGSDTAVVCAKPNDPQAYGSAISYARRYGLQSTTGLASSDDDGEAAMGRKVSLVTEAHTTETAALAASAPVVAGAAKKGSSFRRPGQAPLAAATSEEMDL